MDNAEILVVGFGTAGRVAFSAVREAREMGIPVGLLRPITLSPFPEQALYEAAKNAQSVLVVEMNAGQMLEDVIRIVQGKAAVEFYGRMGGIVPFQDEIFGEITRMAKSPPQIGVDPRQSWLTRMRELLN